MNRSDSKTNFHQATPVFLVLGVLFTFLGSADAAINPKPHLRVSPIRWGKLVLVEEPASTAFSFLIALLCFFTLLEYYQHHQKLKSHYVNYPYHWIWYGFLSLFTLSFTWSTLFHMHETLLLEKLDYIFAILSWGFQVFSAVIVIGKLTSSPSIFLAAVPFILRIGYFIYYMLCVRFDYGYAVSIATQFVLIHTFLWLPWGFWEIYKGRTYGFYIIISHALTAIFVLFELYDFIPIWRIFDGHSLWHLGHLLMVLCWIRFLKLHLRFNSSRQFLDA